MFKYLFVILAEARIQWFIFWTPAYAGVTGVIRSTGFRRNDRWIGYYEYFD